MRPLLPFLVITSLVSTVVIFPTGYQDRYNTAGNVAPFNLLTDSSNLQTSENQNLDSGQWSQSGSVLTISASGVANPQIWAFLTARAAVYFPPLVGTQLVFSGTFSGLNLTSSAIRVVLVLTYLSRVVTLYYLLGDPSIPSNTGSYSNFGVSIPYNGTAFSTHRDVVQDLSNAGAGVDVGWEIRSISFGFAVYSSARVQVPIQVVFNSNQTSLQLQGRQITTSNSSTYNTSYYFVPVLVLAITTSLYAFEPTLRRAIRSMINRYSDRTG